MTGTYVNCDSFSKRNHRTLRMSHSSDPLSSVYRGHHSWLRAWLQRQTGCRETAADLAQDTFVRLLTKPRQPQRAGSDVRALLTHIARCLMIDHWRRQQIERAYLDTLATLPEALAPSPETRWLILDALQRVDAVLQQLPALTREIFLFAQLDGLRYAEIAERTGVSLPTVKRHMRNAFLACLRLE